MQATIQSINLIATDPDVRSGRPYLIGTSVTVADIAIVKLHHAQDADGLADWFGLTLPQVYAALAYYYDHKKTIDSQIYTQLRQAQKFKEQRLGSKDSLLSR
ncbi:MAG: DUF433 domain-containing protein [Anaerolineales bacterium]|nr:DUF433 domain-containing protein [Anaerolineales bacterium]